VIEYKKYRWFFTKADKLIIGGKSASQNDELLSQLKQQSNDYIILHTTAPGSPFAIILADPRSIIDDDKEEAAIFTACFSQAWKQKKSPVSIDLFLLSQLSKPTKLKEGTWMVHGSKAQLQVPLELALTTQKEVLRAVPLKTLGRKKPLALLKPGTTEKKQLIAKLHKLLKLPLLELESALPAGLSQLL